MSVRRGAGSGARGAPRSAGGEQEAAGESPGCSGAAHASARVCARLFHTSRTGRFVCVLRLDHTLFEHHNAMCAFA